MRDKETLQAECTLMQIPYTEADSRESLMDKLRDAHGAWNPALEVDPMKAQDAKDLIVWSSDGNDFSKLAPYFTNGWHMEPKLDGYRARIHIGEDRTYINSGRRSVKDYKYSNRSDNLPHIRDLKVPQGLAGTVLDVELVAFRPDLVTAGGTETNSLLNATVATINSMADKSVETQRRWGPVRVHVFDCVAFDGKPIHNWALDRRQSTAFWVVDQLREHNSNIKAYDTWAPNSWLQRISIMPSSAQSIENALTVGYEGVMIKRLGSTYQPGKRSKDWIKVKHYSTGDFFITGWIPGQGRNTGLVGAVKISYLDRFGQPVEVGQVGSFDDATRQRLSAPDGSLKEECYGLVMEVMGQGLTKNQRIRHPHLVRWRPDKAISDCDWEQLESFSAV